MKNRLLTANERNLFLPALAGFFIAGVWLATRTIVGLWPLWLAAVAALLFFLLRALRMPLRLMLLPIAMMLALLWTQHWLNPAMPTEGTYDVFTATVYGDSKSMTRGT